MGVVAAALCLAGLTGCSGRYHDMPAFSAIPFKDYENHSVGRFKTSYIIDQIDKAYRGANPGPIGVTTLVNVDDLHTTSTFGRMYSEQLMSELALRGFDVVELRHADALQFLSDAGEFSLSRDVGAIKHSRDLGGVLVGTYVVSPVRVYVNIRLIDPATSLVLSAGSVEMSKSKEIARMLRGGSLPSSLERIPVRHLEYTSYPLALFPRRLNRYSEYEGDYGVEPKLYERPRAPRQALPRRRLEAPKLSVESPQDERASEGGSGREGESSAN